MRAVFRSLPHVHVGLPACVAISNAVHSATVGDWWSDDAFISVRCAQNLAKGKGLVLYPGERAERYANFL